MANPIAMPGVVGKREYWPLGFARGVAIELLSDNDNGEEGRVICGGAFDRRVSF